MTSTSELPTQTQTRDLASFTALGCVLLAIGSLGYIAAGILTGGDAARAGFLHPLNAPASGLAALGATVLTVSLAAWRSTALPRWATRLAAAGMLFVAAGAWSSATLLVSLSETFADDETFLSSMNSPWGLAWFAPKAVLLVAFLAVATAGWRSRDIPRAASVALVLAALLSLWPPFPPCGLLAAVGLYLISRRPMPA